MEKSNNNSISNDEIIITFTKYVQDVYPENSEHHREIKTQINTEIHHVCVLKDMQCCI